MSEFTLRRCCNCKFHTTAENWERNRETGQLDWFCEDCYEKVIVPDTNIEEALEDADVDADAIVEALEEDTTADIAKVVKLMRKYRGAPLFVGHQDDKEWTWVDDFAQEGDSNA